MERSKDECICGSRRHKSKWINCDRCRQWFHLICARVTEEDLDKIVKFCCYMCTKRDGGMLTIYRCHACAGCWREHNCGFCASCTSDSEKKCDKRRCVLEKNDPYEGVTPVHPERKSILSSSKEDTPVKTKRVYKKRGRKPKAEGAKVAKPFVSLSNYGRSPNASRKAKEALEGSRPYCVDDMTESSESSEEETPKKKKRRSQSVMKKPKVELTTPPPILPRIYKKRGRKPKSETQKSLESTLPSHFATLSTSNTPSIISTPSESPPFLVPVLPLLSEPKTLEPPPVLTPAVVVSVKQTKCSGCEKTARKNSEFCSNRCWFKKETGHIMSKKIVLESHLRSGKRSSLQPGKSKK
uniref:CXXC-type domain-containing protein n=1 Tax=Panagrolaimus superbus TaxID=310955 RepID=A0A914XYJ8_9BILA